MISANPDARPACPGPLSARLLVALALTAAAPLAAAAHDGHAGQLARADERIAEAPQDSEAWLFRAGLHRRAGALPEARDDLQRAAALGCPARTLIREQVQLADALDAAEVADRLLVAHLAADPRDARAWTLAGERAVRDDRPRVAARAYRRAWAASDAPTPELALAAAAACDGADERGAANALLADGVRRLGPVPGLVLEQVRRAAERGRWDEALAQLDQLGQRDEGWWARRGDLLWQAGRQDESGRAYRQALDALTARSLRRRASPDGMALDTHLRERLAALPTR